ncbi:DUF4395 domain-containing protein [Paenibacillus sp. CC-CFT747]|nr:DUF4395 domain-containing protein [Paenibacillus sp. CC-CFT747]
MPNSIPRPLVRVNQWVIVLSVLLTWATGFYWILALPFVSGLLGVAADFNPVMRAAKLFLRRPMADYIPEDKSQQKFNQLLAVLFLAGALVSYLRGWQTAAYVFSAMVALAAFIAILGFCIGCFLLFQWSQFQHRRRRPS